jgi:phosphatidylglycerophosphate synthase
VAGRKDVAMIAGTIAIVILLLLAGVHAYWALGGKSGKAAAIPTAEGRAVIRPSALGTAMVAVALCAVAALLALRIGWLELPGIAADNLFVQIAAWLIAAVFGLRAVGDFRYVGFFKHIRDTRFARLDTLAYSPLCAVLAVLIGIAAGG